MIRKTPASACSLVTAAAVAVLLVLPSNRKRKDPGSNSIPPSHHPHCVCVASPHFTLTLSRSYGGAESASALPPPPSAVRRWREVGTDPRCSGSRGSRPRGRMRGEILAEVAEEGTQRRGACLIYIGPIFDRYSKFDWWSHNVGDSGF